ncbi:MAG: hypothetical protein Q7U28_04990 [Aquabacterium sp.]|nr:hypothetical protein [Aquabacterium sp.]
MQTKVRIPNLPNKSFFAMNKWFSQMYLAGFLYHPDDAAEDIVSMIGEPIFTAEECIELNKAVGLMFEYHGDKLYDVGLKYMHKALEIKPDYLDV